MMALLLFFSQLKKLKWRGFGKKGSGYWVLVIGKIKYLIRRAIRAIEYRVSNIGY